MKGLLHSFALMQGSLDAKRRLKNGVMEIRDPDNKGFVSQKSFVLIFGACLVPCFVFFQTGVLNYRENYRFEICN